MRASAFSIARDDAIVLYDHRVPAPNVDVCSSGVLILTAHIISGVCDIPDSRDSIVCPDVFGPCRPKS